VQSEKVHNYLKERGRKEGRKEGRTGSKLIIRASVDNIIWQRCF